MKLLNKTIRFVATNVLGIIFTVVVASSQTIQHCFNYA